MERAREGEGGECVILQSRRFEHSCDNMVSVSPVF